MDHQPELRLLLGPAGAGKLERLVALHQRELVEGAKAGQLGGALWLTPTPVAADAVRRRILEGRGAVLGPGIKLLGQGADAIVAGAPAPVRPLTAVQKGQLIVSLVRDPAAAERFAMLRRGALSPGGVELVSRFISRAVQSGEGPDHVLEQAAASGDPHAIELARAYRAYAEETTAKRLLDADARLRMACELLEAGHAGPLKGLGLLVVSGISAPTPLQGRFIEALAASAARAVLAITIDASPEDAEGKTAAGEFLWGGPAAFVERLRRGFPHAQCEYLTPSSSGWAERRHALAHLFRDPRSAAPARVAPAQRRLSVYAARSAQDDARHAARRAKRLLCEGVPPEEIVVAARRVTDVAPRLVEAFAEVGAPLALESAPPLGHAPLAKSLAAVLHLAVSDWRHDDLIAVVTSPRFALFDEADAEDAAIPSVKALCRRLGFAGPRAAVEWTLREVLLPKGRVELLGRLERLADAWRRRVEETASEDGEPAPVARRDRLLAAACLALGPLRRLAELTVSLAPTATPLDWHDRCAALLKGLRYRSPSESAGGPPPASADRAGLAALEEAWASLARLDVWRGAAPAQLDLGEAERRVRDWLGAVRLELPREHEGRVRALGAEAACGLRPAHLIVVGLDEDSFGRIDSRAALPGEPRAEREARERGAEMLLFYELLASARESVTLSYPALDSKGQPLHPSAYVAELERLFEPGALRVREAERDERPLSVAHYRRAAVRELCGGEGAGRFERLLATPSLSPLAHAIAGGLRASHARAHGERFGPWEGVVTGEGARAMVRRAFGPEHLWSAKQLELYAACPFRFFMESVLRVDPLESLELDVDYRRRGSLLHEAMVRFHRAVDAMIGEDEATTSINPERFTAEFAAAVGDALEALATAPHERALAEIEAMQTEAWGRAYREQHEAYDAESRPGGGPPRPRHFETRFGPAAGGAREDDDPLSTDEPYALAAGDERVLLTGQIDRIDVARVNGRVYFNVIDYKTGRSFRVKQSDIESGRLLQLVLYTLAVQEHLLAGEEAAPWQAGYWAVQKKGFATKGIPQPSDLDAWPGLVAQVRTRVSEIVQDIRDARFPMYNEDEQCGGRCEFRTVCRVAQARSLGKLPERLAGESPETEAP